MANKRIASAVLQIEKEGAMRVPGRVFLSEKLESCITDGSLDQVKNVATLPGIVGASIAMPDMHIGYGFPIGGVAAFDAAAEGEGIVSPGGIGFDINCGVRLLLTSITYEQARPFLEALMELLVQAVPTGTSQGKLKLTHEELAAVLREGSGWALRSGYATQADIDHTESAGCMASAAPSAVSHHAQDRGVHQLGTLGGGNHFLEVQRVDQILSESTANAYGLRKDQIVVLIHCGSRGVGHQVCTDYVRAMEDALPEVAAGLSDKNLMYAPLSHTLAKQYLGAMAAAANFAWANRQVITYHVRKAFERLFPNCSVTLLYDVSHNIAKFENYVVDGEERSLLVHRKGATRAFPPHHPEIPLVLRSAGQPVLVPGSMGTSSWVLSGALGSMTESFGSCCHGAGRQWSRSKALAELSVNDVRRSLQEQGILLRGSSSKGIVEEAPQAYKDIDEVIRVVADAGLAVPVARLVPLGVLKG